MALEELRYQIEIPEDVRVRAKRSIDRMLAVSVPKDKPLDK